MCIDCSGREDRILCITLLNNERKNRKSLKELNSFEPNCVQIGPIISGEIGIGFADPLSEGLKTNGCPFATLTPIFVFALLPEQAPQRSKTKCPGKAGDIHLSCGEGGIRTLDTSLSSYNGLANRPFRPLRHLSV